jgi:hypothetical protein
MCFVLRVGLWRSGSALPWHGRGQGFNSPQLHHLVHKELRRFQPELFFCGEALTKGDFRLRALSSSGSPEGCFEARVFSEKTVLIYSLWFILGYDLRGEIGPKKCRET